ncbi:conserved hypothetical protein [Ricinus communis]|uniref:Uncharacterized protein n=1 Tax=Ricinus communis TaxID=3988 RepID=B9S7N6_RICCO|nr:conserved hypothetical protein [Ricinus communis]
MAKNHGSLGLTFKFNSLRIPLNMKQRWLLISDLLLIFNSKDDKNPKFKKIETMKVTSREKKSEEEEQETMCPFGDVGHI